MLVIFALIERGDVHLVSSEVITFELARNPFSERRLFIESVLERALVSPPITPGIIERGKAFEGAGAKAIDALHVACAEALGVDYFITCDDRLLKKKLGPTKLASPIRFVLKLLENSNEDH